MATSNSGESSRDDSPTGPEATVGASTPARHRLSKLFVNHSKKTCCTALLLPILSIVIIIFTRAFQLDSPDGSDYSIRNDIRTRLEDAREAVFRDYPYRGSNNNASDKLETQQVHEPAFDLLLLLRGKFEDTGNLATITKFNGAANVLSRDALQLQKKVEDLIVNDPRYDKFCLKDPLVTDCDGNVRSCVFPESILNHPNLYGIWDETRNLCDRKSGSDLSESDFNAFLDSLKTSDETDPSRSFFPSTLDLDGQSLSTWASRSTIKMGIPLEGFTDIDESFEDQERNFSDWAEGVINAISDLSTNSFDASAVSYDYINSQFDSIVSRDLSFAIFAIILVFITMWVHTTSAFLASIAMLQIFLSFPLSYFIYYFIFRQAYFSALQILTIFLVLGIGADDVFVFTDAWKQAPLTLGPDVDLVTRMAWTYRRAVRAMTVTSLTTAAAFFVTASSPIMPISTLGVWAGILILVQYFFVISVYPCAIAIWHRFWRTRLAIRFFKKVDQDMVEKEVHTPLWHRFLPPSRRPTVKSPASGEYRGVERFFRGPWFRVISKARFIIVAIAIVLAGLAIWAASKLKPPEKEEEFLPSDHPLRAALITFRDAFPLSDEQQLLNVFITWGIKDVDRKGTSRFDLEEHGTPVFDERFDFSKATVQNQVLEACTFFDQKDLVFQGDSSVDVVDCWIKEYKKWRKDVENKDDFEDFDSGKAQVEDLIKFGEYEEAGIKVNLKYLENMYVVFDLNYTRVIMTDISFVTPIRAQEPYSVMWPVYNTWQDELEKFNSGAPSGGDSAVATGGQSWVYQITQRTLVSSMYSGIGIMMAVAFCTLVIATLNWFVSILAILCIAFIIALLLGVIYVIGWALGITETIAVIISIGYSFDGVAHIATAYIESKSVSRADRTRDALTDLGISILFGVISTLLAGFMLFPAVIIFFFKFAALIVATVAFNLIVGLGLFPALLTICGPEGDFGSLVALYRKVTGRGRRHQSPKDLENGGEAENQFEEGSRFDGSKVPASDESA